jgi:hypothetical protein
MVKLLRLCVDYGESKVIAAATQLQMQENLSLEQIGAFLTPVSPVSPIHVSNEIKVRNTPLTPYDKLLNRSVAL